MECEGLEEGCTYREVVKSPFGQEEEMQLRVEQLEDCRDLAIRCINTGTYVRFLLMEAQDGTFVEGEMGMDPKTVGTRIFDTVAGQRYFRNWLQQTLESLGDVAQRQRVP